MDPARTLLTLGKISAFFLRHAIATTAIVLVSCALLTAGYVVLLMWAMVAGGDPGGALFYPAGLLVCLAGGLSLSLLVFFPCTALAEWIAKRKALPFLFQIPISAGILAAACLLFAIVTGIARRQATLEHIVFGSAIPLAMLLLPLGFYWWIAQSGPLLHRVYRRIQNASSPRHP